MVILIENPKVLASNILKYGFFLLLIFLGLVLPGFIDMTTWWGSVIAFSILFLKKCLAENNPDLEFEWFGTEALKLLKKLFNK